MKDYRPAGHICRKCIGTDVSAEELAAYLDGYVNSLPEDIRTSPEEYEKRLKICEECDRRISLTCTLCG